MGYWEQADQPFCYSVAGVFPVADRCFCSVLGQTYPNRRYLISATGIPPDVPAGEPSYDGFHRYGFRGAVRGRCPVGAPGLRVPRGEGSHQHLRPDRGQVEPARDDELGHERGSHAGHARAALPGVPPAARLARPLLATYPGAMACSVTGPGTIPPPGWVSPGP